MLILLVRMSYSPYNRSIWTGFGNAFRRLGHQVQEVDGEQLPPPDALPELPALLLAVHGGNVPLEMIDRYRERGVTTAIHLLDEPYEVDRTVLWSRHYDWALPVDRATVPVHARHTSAVHLPLAYDDAVFITHGSAIASDILVLGSPFSAREEFLAPVRNRWGTRVTWVGPGWRKFSAQGQHVEQFVSPEDCARFYRGAKIVINIHRDASWSHFGELNREHIAATHLNPRFWEASGCGAFQLVSDRADLHRYEPRAVSFNVPDELIRQIEYFLDNEPARTAIARRIHRAIRDETYVKRAKTVLDLLTRRTSAAATET